MIGVEVGDAARRLRGGQGQKQRKESIKQQGEANSFRLALLYILHAVILCD